MIRLPASRSSSPRSCRSWLLALSLVTAAVSAAAADAATAAAKVSADGIGPLRLGAALDEAARRTVPLDPAAAMIGPGCDERDQVSVVLELAGQAMSVMAMADARGRIEEILATPAGNAGLALADEAACQAHGAGFAARLGSALGTAHALPVERKPVSVEFAFQFSDGARVVSRWFAGGRSCDLLLHFGGRDSQR
ncbi:MAG: hypothetical protein ACYCWL_00290 [Thauera sp.]